MLRNRVFQKSATRFQLTTFFSPSYNSDDLNEDHSAVIVALDFRRFSFLTVSRCASSGEKRYYPLPPLSLIHEETEFLINFYNSLMPYETSSPSESPHFEEI